MSKLVIIAGIKRSGSTWLYNAVRLCLLHAGKTVHIAGDGQYYEENPPTDYQIIKTHPYVPWMAEKADYVFTSDRDDEGIRASWLRFQNKHLDDDDLAEWRAWLAAWRTKSCFHLKWEDLRYKWRGLVVKQIAERLELALTMEDIAYVCKKLGALRPPADKDYDPVTFLFHNHITSA